MSKRAIRRHHARRVRIATQRCLARRTKGLWLWDDPECFACVVKRDDREQTGRRRINCGALPGVARRLKADKLFNPLTNPH